MQNPIDLETRLQAQKLGETEESHQSLKVWLRLLSCSNLIQNEIRSRLRAHDTTLPRFDFMAQLEREPAGLRMGELSQRLMVTGGNVTGIADQLTKEGLITRETDAADRRAFTVHLTEAGRSAFAAMAAEHEAWVESLTAGLDADDKRSMIGLLSKLKRHVGATIQNSTK